MVRPSLPKPCLVFTRPSLPTPCWSLPPPRTSTAYRARPYCERLHRARPYCAPLRCVRLPPFQPSPPAPARLVLASDGLWDVVDEQMCGNSCARATDPLDAARTLCELASTRGSMDNITVLVVAL